MSNNNGSKTLQFVKAICQGRTEKEIAEAQETFKEYLLVIRDICDRLEREGKKLPEFDDWQQVR